MPRLSRACTSLCSLAMALALIALAANTYAKDPHHLLSHNRQQHPPQQHPPQQHHQPAQHQLNNNHDPTLAGALFPIDSEILAGKKEYAKEPCPVGCVHHRSDIYLAVTSIGEGFPRIQFTCSHAHPSQPTANAEGNHQHYQQHHAHPGHSHGQGDNIIQEPADPTPEHMPHPPSHGSSKHNHHDSHERNDGASTYTDLHVTADSHFRGLGPMDRNVANAAAGFNPHYGVIFSPRERSHSVDLNDDAAESHTTTMTFSDDDSSHIEQVASSERRSIPLTAADDDEQDPHHQQVHILPVRDHHHRHDVSTPGSLHRSSGSGSATPEPTATIVAPTSSSFGAGSDRGGKRMNDDRTVSKAAAAMHHGHEYKAGPAMPTPEAFPGQTNTGHVQSHDHSHHQQQLQGDVSVGGKEKVAGGENSIVQYRTIIHRVITLIIETETIVNRPTVTPTATAAAFLSGSKDMNGRA